jgi:hypothetical protein
MLSGLEIQAHLESLTYKPGWAWELHHDPWEGYYIRFLIDVPDSHGHQPMTLGISSWLPPMQNTDQLDLFMAWRIGRIESHESREFLKRAGRPVFDPHLPDAA